MARAIADTVAAGGGILSAGDLASYAPKVLDEPPADYRGWQLTTAADTVGYEVLGILERFPLRELGCGTAEHYHLLAEAMGHAFADNATYACDPDYTEDPVERLGDPGFAAARAATHRPRPGGAPTDHRDGALARHERRPRARPRRAACTEPHRWSRPTARATWPP